VSRLRSRLATARPDLLVVSGDEAESILAGPQGRALTAALALRELASVVIVTSGADGSAAVAAELRIEVAGESLPGPMLDATGSGDAFVAGLIADLAGAAGWPPAEQLLRAAMGAATRLGAQVTRVIGAQGRVAGEPSAA
jgi:sugar/nucleoside kinase (ribokinase family)